MPNVLWMSDELKAGRKYNWCIILCKRI